MEVQRLGCSSKKMFERHLGRRRRGRISAKWKGHALPGARGERPTEAHSIPRSPQGPGAEGGSDSGAAGSRGSWLHLLLAPGPVDKSHKLSGPLLSCLQNGARNADLLRKSED